MSYKQYNIIRTIIGLLIATIVMMAIIINNFQLAFTGLFIGMLFLFLAKSKFKKVVVDERVISVSKTASRVTYSVVTMFLAFSGIFSVFIARNNENLYLESLGTVFCYISLLMIIVYSISYYYFNKKYGADE